MMSESAVRLEVGAKSLEELKSLWKKEERSEGRGGNFVEDFKEGCPVRAAVPALKPAVKSTSFVNGLGAGSSSCWGCDPVLRL